MPQPRKYPAKFKQLSDKSIPFEKRMELTREFATKYPKDFNKQLDRIAPDEYRGTRKLANMLIQAYPQRFPNVTGDQLVDMMDKIGKHESPEGNVAQRVMNPKTGKIAVNPKTGKPVEGPGRGHFQIEVASAPYFEKTYDNYRTNYLKNYSSVPLPNIDIPKSGDVRVLPKDQQASLGLSKISARAGSNVVDPNDAKNVWLNYWWAGSEKHPEDVADRKAAWDRSMKEIKAVPQMAEYKKGGWTGYPDHTMYSSGMEQFDKVRDYTKYADGGAAEMSSPLNVPQGYFLNPGQSRIQPKIFYPEYVPGQNAAKGSIEESISPLDFIGGVRGASKVAKGLLKYNKAIKPNYIDFNGSLIDLGRHPKTVNRALKKIHQGFQDAILPSVFKTGGKVTWQIID